ncbi:MAG: dTDP-4-dehydrorhamnose reductase [Succinivibrio sp.]|nr:dTDP-4-dehydrorhamnose reductase [Succinivibrio sp.]
MERILVTGAHGQLGREVVEALLHKGHQVIATSHQELAVEDEDCVRGAVCNTDVKLVINCAAYTKVDKAEQEAKLCERINADGPRNLARACAEAQIPLIHVSTDYVLDTETGSAHREEEQPQAHCVYGRTKLLGEQYIQKTACSAFIFRISWVFGRYGQNFVKTMLRLAATHPQLRIVCDELGAPTPARAFAEFLASIAESVARRDERHYGIYHYCGTPYCTWAEFAREIFTAAKDEGLLENIPLVQEITAKEYGAQAQRPHDSRLNTDKIVRTFNLQLPDWHAYLSETLHAKD